MGNSTKERKNDYESGKNDTLCTYCQRPMSKYDFDVYHGICGKCREIKDWKQIIDQSKNK